MTVPIDTSPEAVAVMASGLRYEKFGEAADMLEALAARVAGIAYTRHTDTMNDIVLMGLARDAAEADLATARNAALEELQGAVQLLRRQAGGNADGIRFQALDDVRQMIRKRLDTLKEPTP